MRQQQPDQCYRLPIRYARAWKGDGCVLIDMDIDGERGREEMG